MKLYITDLSLFVLAVFYLPLVLWMLWRLWRSPRWQGAKKAGVLFLSLLLAYAIPLGDVTFNSLAMAKVCPSAGLHIYRTVEVDGYLTDIGDGNILKQYPYQFIETKTYQSKPDGGRYWRRYERQTDGTISSGLIDQPKAEYELLDGEWHYDKEHGISVMQDVIRNRVSGEVLAERNLFNPLPGWLDRVLVYRWFGYGGQHGCWGTPASMVDVGNILIPKAND